MAPSIELTRIRLSESSRFLTEESPRLPEPTDVGDLFSQSRSNDENTLAAIHPAWKRNLHALLEQPKSSSSAFLIHMLTTFLILFSALVTILETVPEFHSISTRAWFGVETSLVALFTVEYIARCLAWSGSWMSFLKWTTCMCFQACRYALPSCLRNFLAFFGIIDLLSVAPYYIEILLQQDTVCSIPICSSFIPLFTGL
jgi:potassium voltage-gated channel Shal-related subfamily D protein 2